MAWPKKRDIIVNQHGNGVPENQHVIPSRLSYAEEALRSMSLPEGIFYYHGLIDFSLDVINFMILPDDAAFAEIVLNLPQALQQLSSGGAPIV